MASHRWRNRLIVAVIAFFSLSGIGSCVLSQPVLAAARKGPVVQPDAKRLEAWVRQFAVPRAMHDVEALDKTAAGITQALRDLGYEPG